MQCGIGKTGSPEQVVLLFAERKQRRSVPDILRENFDTISEWFALDEIAMRHWNPLLISDQPTDRLRIEGIGSDHPYFNVIALGAFEQPMFEANWPWRNAFQHHPRLATKTPRALNSGQELLG